jgi:predicted branched-subunit amino acid permease
MRGSSDLRSGAIAVAPMLVGVIPFGLVAGASPVDEGLGGWAAVGFSTIVFAGASQLAAIDALGAGGSAIVAALAAWTINLRMLLYSASLAPYLAAEPLWKRAGMAYLLTDQAYAVSLVRWQAGGPPATPARRVPFYLGAALTLWGSWQASTIVGVFLGNALPEDAPLEFAVPLVFLVLLVPVLISRPAVMAAVAGGGGAVLAAELGAGTLSIIVGAVSGIAAGAIAESIWPDDEVADEPDETPEMDV